ncbi:hypothetical protein [Variovorax sp. dw_954]|uniref:sensor histidine kinase n=1 Tax=Variovorax sp. dw_954 TaxID=2720078 RepID=UPI001BD5DC0C|nr:hypothetical protein [Variovorax sp. dw_954]
MTSPTSIRIPDREWAEAVDGLQPDRHHPAALKLLVHELCAPVQLLVAASEDLIFQELDEEGRTALARIHRATQRILTQLNDLEALAQIQLDCQRPHRVSFEVGALLKEVAAADRLRHIDNNSRAAVKVPDLPIFVKGEAHLIQLALDRLVRTVLNGPAGQVMLSIGSASSSDRPLSIRMQCLASSPWSSWSTIVTDRLSLVGLIADYLHGGLCVSDGNPTGPSFELRVDVEVEDPESSHGERNSESSS